MSIGPNDPIRPLGRKTELTMKHWGAIAPRRTMAGRPLGGTVPRKSVNLTAFANPFLWHQRRGFCVGYALAAICIETYRIPNGVRDGSVPLPSPRFSPLYSYGISRMEAKRRGINLGAGDGSICSIAADAAARDGFLLWDKLPATPAREDAWRNNQDLPGSLLQEGRERLLVKAAACETLEQGLEHLAAGFVLYAGIPCRQGMTETDSLGRFDPLAGRIIGGHAVRFLRYDLDADELDMGNSWPRWGRQDAAAPSGYTNVGTCKLSRMERLLTPDMLKSGQSELIAINVIQGEPTGDPWAPKTADYQLLAPPA